MKSVPPPRFHREKKRRVRFTVSLHPVVVRAVERMIKKHPTFRGKRTIIEAAICLLLIQRHRGVAIGSAAYSASETHVDRKANYARYRRLVTFFPSMTDDFFSVTKYDA